MSGNSPAEEFGVKGVRHCTCVFMCACTVEPLRYGPLRYGHLPQPGSLFYADIAEIVGSTVGVAYYSLCIYMVF